MNSKTVVLSSANSVCVLRADAHDAWCHVHWIHELLPRSKLCPRMARPRRRTCKHSRPRPAWSRAPIAPNTLATRPQKQFDTRMSHLPGAHKLTALIFSVNNEREQAPSQARHYPCCLGHSDVINASTASMFVLNAAAACKFYKAANVHPCGICELAHEPSCKGW